MKNTTIIFLLIFSLSTHVFSSKTGSLTGDKYLVCIQLAHYDDIYELGSLEIPILQDLNKYVIASINSGQYAFLQAKNWQIEILDTEPEKNLYFLAKGYDNSEVHKAGEILFVFEDITLFKTDEDKLKKLTTRHIDIKKLSRHPIILPKKVENNRNASEITGHPLIEEMVDAVTENDVESTVRTLQDFVSRNSRNTGCYSAVDHVYDLFLSYGLTNVYKDTYTSNFAPNLIGTLEGLANPDSIFILCGHIDATAGNPWSNESVAPGADDNGIGTAVVILAAKIMSQYDFRYTVRFICFTGEEQGLQGSDDYAYAHNNDNIYGVVNFDMCGRAYSSNEDLDITTNSSSVWLADFMIQAASTYVGLEANKHISTTMCASDNSSFWSYGIAGVNGIEEEDCCYINPYYHSVGDTIGGGLNSIPFSTDVVKSGLATIAELAVPYEEATNIQDNAFGEIGSGIKISQNWPNPFHEETYFNYRIGATGNKENVKHISLMIYNIYNQHVCTLIDKEQEPGAYKISWNGKDMSGNNLPAGVYLYKLSDSRQTLCGRAMLIR